MAIDVYKVNNVVPTVEVIEEEAMFSLLNATFPIVSRVAANDNSSLPCILHAVQCTECHQVVKQFDGEGFVADFLFQSTERRICQYCVEFLFKTIKRLSCILLQYLFVSLGFEI